MSEWKTIDSAPKDGTVVLLFCPKSWDSEGVRVGWWCTSPAEHNFDDSGWYDDESASHDVSDLYGEPTHWMPLPEPPK